MPILYNVPGLILTFSVTFPQERCGIAFKYEIAQNYFALTDY